MNEEAKVWQGYSAATTDTEALAMFRVKFGRKPQELRRSAGCVLVGPLTEQEANHD